MAALGVQGQALLLPASEECLLRISGQVHHQTSRLVKAPAVGPDQVDVCKGSPCRYRQASVATTRGTSQLLSLHVWQWQSPHILQGQSSEDYKHVRNTNCASCASLPSAPRRDLTRLQAHLHQHTAPQPAWQQLCPGP